MTTDKSSSSYIYKEVPLYAKTLIVVQTLVIVFFSFWFYQEYTYNTFFQTWLNGYILTNQLLLLTLFSGLTFAAVAVGVAVRSHHAKTNLALTSTSKEAATSLGTTRTGNLDVGTEQHLIDMIRRNASPNPSNSQAQAPIPPSTNPSPGQGMPTLQRRDPNQQNTA
jgi:hypothetical protein